jgi:hypothetical protein
MSVQIYGRGGPVGGPYQRHSFTPNPNTYPLISRLHLLCGSGIIFGLSAFSRSYKGARKEYFQGEN